MSAVSLPARLAGLPRQALLRLALKLDAVVTGANGAAYLLVAGPLEDLLGVEAALLRGVGAFLLVFAAAVWIVATRPAISRNAVVVVIEANVAWAVGSVVVAAAGMSDATTVGTIWIVMQAAVVAAFAALQLAARRG